MAQTALVTGATGLLGRQVFKAFESAGWPTTGTGFNRGAPPKMVKVDIRDESQVIGLLDTVQ